MLMISPTIIGSATLYQCDAREIAGLLPKADAIITDPVWPNCPEGLLPGADGDQQNLLRAVLAHLEAATLVILMGYNSDPRFLSVVPARWPYIRSQQLPYAMPGYAGRLLAGDEIAYVFGAIPQGTGVIPGRARVVVSPKATRSTGHPCPRADLHLEQLVGWWSPGNGVVIDPFMGTGSTGVACAKQGRRFVGVEIDSRYFDLACTRNEGRCLCQIPQSRRWASGRADPGQ